MHLVLLVIVLFKNWGGSGAERKDIMIHLAFVMAFLPYNTLVVASGVAAVGCAAGVIGTFGVLRKRALVGDAAAHATLVGVALALLVTGQRNLAVLLVGGLVSASLSWTGLCGQTYRHWT
mgnify:CR=1 FL=1